MDISVEIDSGKCAHCGLAHTYMAPELDFGWYCQRCGHFHEFPKTEVDWPQDRQSDFPWD